jgi:hypothetical protein
MKKMKRRGSFLSMENLDLGDDSSPSENDDDFDSPNKSSSRKGGSDELDKYDSENIKVYPIYILG